MAKRPTKKKNPFAAFEKKDKARDKKLGIKENSPRDKKMDKRGK